MNRPYIVTEDLELLMGKWAKETGFVCPGHSLFLSLQEKLLNYLKRIFPNVVFIGAESLSSSLKEMVGQQTGPVVSIDQIYNNAQYHLQSNRIADLATMEIIGEAQRPGHLPLVEQIKLLPNGSPFTLVDDGCMTGETLCRIYELILEQGYEIQNVVVGISVDRANNRLVKSHPEVNVITAHEFPRAIDWVCERDFYVGVPLSGRTAGVKEDGLVVPCDPEIALPYCLPFGDPIKGASIPTELVVDYSRFVIGLSLELWAEVQECSGRKVCCNEVPRLPKGITRDNRSFVLALSESRPSKWRISSF